MAWAKRIVSPSPPPEHEKDEGADGDDSQGEEAGPAEHGTAKTDGEIVDLAASLAFGGLQVCLAREGRRLTALDIGGLEASTVRIVYAWPCLQLAEAQLQGWTTARTRQR